MDAPNEYVRFFEDVIPHFLLPPALMPLLAVPGPPDVETGKLAHALAGFPEDYALFLDWIRSRREKEEGTLTDEALIRAYGLENTRHFVFTLAVHGIANRRFEWVRGQPKSDPARYLKCARAVEEDYSGRSVSLAFAAGLSFDILAAVADRLRDKLEVKPLQEFVYEVLKTRIATAGIATAISKRVGDLKLANFVYSACIMQGTGDVALAILNDAFRKFFLRVRGDGLPGPTRSLCEQKLFGVTADQFGGLICQFYSTFEPIADSVRCQKRPYLLKNQGKDDLYRLAAVCRQASVIEARPQLLKDAEDPKIAEEWLVPEIGGALLDAGDLFSVMASLK